MKKAKFQKARAIWAENRSLEMNCELIFQAQIPRLEKTKIVMATSGIYRLWVNGTFVAAGPARTAHGFFRVDEYEISARLTECLNTVTIEVLGYNVNSYDTLNQSSFFTAEIQSENQIITYTGEDGFKIYDYHQRVRKVQRYSFQRAFIDVYQFPGIKKCVEQKLEFQKEPCYIEREVRYPSFETLAAESVILEGKATFNNENNNVISEQEYFKISNQLLGFTYEEEEEHVSEEAQKICFYPESREEQVLQSKFLENGYVLYRFPYNATGFFRLDIEANEKSRVFVEFDEILIGEDIDFLRMYSCNCFLYIVEPGHHQIMSFAPYTMKYLKVIVNGICKINNVEMIEYKHSEVRNKVKLPQTDKDIQLIYQAALESFKANSLDIFMDCPSRERGGWLCDSYFTSSVERVLTGESLLDQAFLENYILDASFDCLPDGMLPMCYPADHYNKNYIPNWAMWYVLQLEKYIKNTNNFELAERAKIAVYRLVEYYQFYENENGLLEDLDGWIFVEWSRANAEELTNGVNFPTNMLYVRFLLAAGSLYKDKHLIKKSVDLRKMIRERSLKGIFYTDHEQRDKNGWFNSGECTEVCQYYAFFTGVATKSDDKILWETLVREFGLVRRKYNNYPEIAFTNAFIGNYLRIELLYENGMYDEVIDNIKGFFLPMAKTTGTLWEHEKPTASCNHGFASYVIYWLAGIYGVEK